MKTFVALIPAFFFTLNTLHAAAAPPTPPKTGPVVVHEIRYTGKLTDDAATFTAALKVESTNTVATALTLFQGELAVIDPKLPNGLRLARIRDGYQLIVEKPGQYNLTLNLLPRITKDTKTAKADPWRQISFTGPIATIGVLTATVAGNGQELELLSGTPLPRAGNKAAVQGALGADRKVSLRWQAKVTEQVRRVLLTAQTAATIHLNPTVAKFTTRFNYDILQGKPTNLTVALPSGQSITKVDGINIKNWAVNGDTLTIDFVQATEKTYALTLHSEQPLSQATAGLTPPAPLGVERESGNVQLTAEDVTVETGTLQGLRKVNAADGQVGAWRFFGRAPFALPVTTQRIEPAVGAHCAVDAHLSESRLRVYHRVTLKVAKAGIYSLTLGNAAVLTGTNKFTVANVTSDGLTDWKLDPATDLITLQYQSRVLGNRLVTVELEKPADKSKGNFTLLPLNLGTLAKEPFALDRQTARITARASAGLRLSGGILRAAREVAAGAAEALAFAATQPDWSVTLSAEPLKAIVTAEVFNLATIGDGLLRGSATIRFGIVNQGVKTFTVRVPGTNDWKNVEFAGANIRARQPVPATDGSTVDWTLKLQEKAWNGYTLVVSYDNQFDSNAANLSLGVAQPQGLERVTGTLALTGASNIELTPNSAKTGFRQIDAAELDEADRGVVNRSILFAYKYDVEPSPLAVTINQHSTEEGLDAVADRTLLRTQINPDGQLITLAAYTVKNTNRQFMGITLPAEAKLTYTGVDGESVTPRTNADGKVLVPLPSRLNRNHAFYVEIMYTEELAGEVRKRGALESLAPVELRLEAPLPDLPHTGNAWQVYLDPNSHELFDFGGNMVPQRAEPYNWVNVWRDISRVLRRTHWDSVVGLLVFFGIAFGLLQLALRKGRKALLIGLGALVALLVISSILLPAVTRSSLKIFQTADGYTLAETSPRENADAEAHSYGGEEGEESEDSAKEGKNETRTETASTKSSPPNSTAPKPVQPGKPGGSRAVDPNSGIPSGGGIGGGGGGMSGGAGEGTTGDRGLGDSSTRAPMVQGIRGVRQTIPANGRVFYFTKAIHSSESGGEAMIIEAQVMDSKQRKVRRGFFQLLALLTGLWVLWRQFRVPENRHTLVITGGIAMAYGAVIWACFHEQSVHQLFACTLWTLGLTVLAWVTWYFWPTCQACQTEPAEPTENSPTDDDSSSTGGASGGAAATAAFAIFLGLQSSLSAQPDATPAAKLTPEQIRIMLVDLLTPKVTGPKRISEAQLQDRNGTRFEVNGDAPFTGIVTGLFANQQKRIESHYQNGQLHGVEILWHENGSKRSSSPYASGKLHGPQTSWRRDGTRSAQQIYQNGQLHGNQITWHPNGKKATETPWAKGEPHGLARQWHANGEVAREVRWDRGRQLSFDTWDAKGVRANTGTNTVSLVSATYTMTIHPKVAVVEAEFMLDARADAQAFTLFREHLAIDTFSCTQAGATLRRTGPTLEIKLPNAGEATAKVKFLIKHTGDATQRTLAFGIPPALVSHVTATLNEPDAEMELPTGVTAKTDAADKVSTLTGIIGANDSLRLTWKPRVQKAREIAATVFVKNANHVIYQRGLIRTRTQLDYQVTQGELRRVRVQLPPAAAGHKLMRVTAPQLRNWVMGDGDDDSVLVVNLAQPATKDWQLVLELEQPLAAPPNDAAVTVPHALDVKRETGLVALQTGDDLDLTVAQSVNLTKKNAEDFTAVVKAAKPVHVFSYLNTFTLAARVAAVEPRLEAEVRQHFHVGANALRLTSHINYTIKKTGVFNLSLALPEGYRVEKVHGANIANTNLVDGNLKITLSQRTIGAYGLRMDLQQQQPLADNAVVTVVGVHPLGTHKLTGYVAVGSEPGLEVTAGVAQGLTEIPAAELASRQPNASGHAFGAMPFTLGTNVLAYKHISTMPDDSLGWSLTVNTTRRPVWVTAELVNHLKVSETHLEGRTVIRYTIKNAPTQEFRIRVPKQFKNVEFEGKDIRNRHEDPKVATEWIVRLQNKTLGTYNLALTWEWKDWSLAQTNQFTFTGPQVQGAQMPAGQSPVDPTVERETGWVTVQVANTTPLQVEEATAVVDPLAAMDAANLPEGAQMDPPPALTYQYLRPGWQLAVRVNQFETVAVLQTSITRARFTSVLTQDGRMLTQARLDVVNNGGQTMTLKLPESDDRLWSAFVAGQAVRAARTQKGAYLLPLEQSENNAAFTVEFTYESSTPFPDGSGLVKLESPRLNVPLQDAQWQLHLPRDYKYSDFEGSMTYAKRHHNYPQPMRQHAATRVSQSSAASGPMPNDDMDQRAYESKARKDEKEKRDEQSKLFSSTLRNTVDNIKAGNVEDANKYFDQARRQDAASGNSDRKKLKDLERQVRQLQALKLNESQFKFNYRNSARYAQQANLPNQKPTGQSQSSAQHAGDNAEAALEQVEMLQKSQELTERTVAPLHITLPRHGTVHHFNQSLQMKPGEPMTIEFEAANTENPDWLMALGALLLTLAVLYGFVRLARAALRKPEAKNA